MRVLLVLPPISFLFLIFCTAGLLCLTWYEEALTRLRIRQKKKNIYIFVFMFPVFWFHSAPFPRLPQWCHHVPIRSFVHFLILSLCVYFQYFHSRSLNKKPPSQGRMWLRMVRVLLGAFCRAEKWGGSVDGSGTSGTCSGCCFNKSQRRRRGRVCPWGYKKLINSTTRVFYIDLMIRILN